MSATPPLLLASGELEVQETHVPIFPGLRPIFPGLRPIRAKARLWRCVGVNEHRIRLWKSLEGRKPFQTGSGTSPRRMGTSPSGTVWESREPAGSSTRNPKAHKIKPDRTKLEATITEERTPENVCGQGERGNQVLGGFLAEGAGLLGGSVRTSAGPAPSLFTYIVASWSLGAGEAR